MENTIKTVSVSTPCGEIVGEVTDYGARFRGVPYARAARFEKPKRIEKYDVPVDATKQGVCCPQMRAYWSEEHRFYYREFRVGQTFTYDENCQILNLFVPKEAKNCPVLLFIHGGSFTGGSVNEKHFDGSAYARRGILFVSINYRLNVFGSFVDGVHSNGNLHLFDQCAAIDWVKENVSSFGGDPDKITLMGQSAGAMSVQTLICTDRVKDKVRGAIMLSGGGKRVGLLPLSRPNKGYWRRLMSDTGAKDFDEYQKMPTKEVWEKWKTTRPIGKAFETKIVVDGELVKNKSYDTAVPVILGVDKKDLLPPLLNHMARAFARKQRRKGLVAYLFAFDRLLPPDGASFHAGELWYALGSLSNSSRPFTKEDYDLSDEMVDRFAAFARSGDPNTDGKKTWAPYRSKKDILRWE